MPNLINPYRFAAGGAGNDADAQTYITAVNAARSSESAAALTTTAEEIIDDMIQLLKGGSAANGQLTGLTAVNCWASIQHFVMFRGAGNVGTGSTVKAIVGSDGTLVNGHPWDARGNGSNQYIDFAWPYTITDAETFFWGGLWDTFANSQVAAWVCFDEASGNPSADLCYLIKNTAASGQLRALGMGIDRTIVGNTPGAEIKYSLVLDSGSATLDVDGATSTDSATSANGATPDTLFYNKIPDYSMYSDSRPHYGLIVSSVLDATDRANVHAILQAAYDALAAL